MIKFVDCNIKNIPFLKCFFALLDKKLKQSKVSIEAKFFEKYSETNVPGIYLSDKETETIEKRLFEIKQETIKECLENDYIALNNLLYSKGWKVFLKYIEGMEFDINEGTLTERLAFKQAKEQAVSAVLSIPECLIKFYDKEMKGN